MHEVVELVKGWKQRRRGLAVQRRLTCVGQIIEAMAVLWLEGRHHRHHPFHTSGPLLATREARHAWAAIVCNIGRALQVLRASTGERLPLRIAAEIWRGFPELNGDNRWLPARY